MQLASEHILLALQFMKPFFILRTRAGHGFSHERIIVADMPDLLNHELLYIMGGDRP